MKRAIFLSFFFILTYPLYPQTSYKTVESVFLQQVREVKIDLPKGYEENKEKLYPLILVLDADYLFEPMAGNVGYYSFWNEMPESIVIGVNQSGFRQTDTSYDKETSFPTEKGTDFYDFLKRELLPHIKKNYRTNEFAVIIGQGRTANFLNYFLLENRELFDAYVNLSPIYAPKMEDRIVKKLKDVKDPLWYYLAIAANDFQAVKNSALYLKDELDAIENENLIVHFDNFGDKNHYSMVGYAIPAALEKIFLPFGPIHPSEYVEKVLENGTYCDYLLNKYESIEDLYGWEPKIRIHDFMFMAAAIEENEKWEEYDELSKMARKNLPETMLEGYFEARYFEETGKPKRAFRSYEDAYSKKEVSFLTKSLIWERMNQLK